MFMYQKTLQQITLPTTHPGVTGWCAVALSLLLAACANDKFEDLNEYVKEVQTRPGIPIAPLPEIKPYERFVYRDENLRDPFRPAVKAPPPSASSGNSRESSRSPEIAAVGSLPSSPSSRFAKSRLSYGIPRRDSRRTRR